jgi:hypothetical protein
MYIEPVNNDGFTHLLSLLFIWKEVGRVRIVMYAI